MNLGRILSASKSLVYCSESVLRAIEVVSRLDFCISWWRDAWLRGAVTMTMCPRKSIGCNDDGYHLCGEPGIGIPCSVPRVKKGTKILVLIWHALRLKILSPTWVCRGRLGNVFVASKHQQPIQRGTTAAKTKPRNTIYSSNVSTIYLSFTTAIKKRVLDTGSRRLSLPMVSCPRREAFRDDGMLGGCCARTQIPVHPSASFPFVSR